jgi:hypothetical protein
MIQLKIIVSCDINLKRKFTQVQPLFVPHEENTAKSRHSSIQYWTLEMLKIEREGKRNSSYETFQIRVRQ